MRSSWRAVGQLRRSFAGRRSGGHQSMLQIHLSQVPLYLRTGQLYRYFSDNCEVLERRTSKISISSSDEMIEIHRLRLKGNTVIHSVEDLQQLLESLRFWACDDLPYEVFHFSLTATKFSAAIKSVLAEYEAHFDELSVLKDVMGATNTTAALEIAARRGSLTTMRCIFDLENMRHGSVMNTMKHRLLRRMLSQTSRTLQMMLPTLCEVIVRSGHLHCLQYVHEAHGFPINSDTCAAAAEGGSLECLQYCHEHSMNGWDERVCVRAAEQGHIDCLRYAHENVCPWNESVSLAAAMHGHLDCLQYAHENGCQWRRRAALRLGKGRAPIQLLGRNPSLNTTTENKHLQCLNYMYQHGLI